VRAGHFNVNGWMGPINAAMQRLLEFRDMASAGITPGSMSQHKSSTRANIAPVPDWHPPGRADGGYAPARPGGTAYTLGEGGEGEYIIPESKMGKRGGDIVINVANVNGTDRRAAEKFADMVGGILMQQVRFA
ncbi:MAG TPA: hypothetical protein VFC59_05940, partial [Cryobacterium sp.]|nr:hypothetical protein [Cryobacterium sp.]